MRLTVTGTIDPDGTLDAVMTYSGAEITTKGVTPVEVPIGTLTARESDPDALARAREWCRERGLPADLAGRVGWLMAQEEGRRA